MSGPSSTDGQGSVLVTGIGRLVTNDPTAGDGSPLGALAQAAVAVTSDEAGVPRVEWTGPADQAPSCDRVVDVEGACVIPGFVDSHSHLVFAGERSAEFAARMAGRRYDGGGIATTVRATRGATDDDLAALVAGRIAEMRAQGTTAVEIKSGYGLTVDDESRALRIARAAGADAVTYLGAHVVPAEFADDRAGYVDLVTGPMLDACAPLADWADVFCEPASAHAFDGDESREILTRCAAAGLGLRMHGNQLGHGPGVQLAVELGAAAVDHCTFLSDADIDALAGAAGTTVATLLPGVEFSTRSPYPPARRLIDAGASVAIATDCNPGTCYSSSMPFMVALAVRELGMTTAEAVLAATVGGAEALRRDDLGHLRVGARADLVVLNAPTEDHLAYRPGVLIAKALDLG